MIYALIIVSLYAAAITALWRSSARSVGSLMDRLMRANGQFAGADAELNSCKVKLSQALMQLEDARK